MTLSYPDYYKTFSCIASACPDSCCHEWEVCVDPEACARYQALPGPLGDRLRQVLRQEDGDVYMTIENSRCPMWRQDGLCAIQAQLGHDALCKTCREFPRLRHDYGNFTELGLELSCPEAARLIFCASGNWIREALPGGEEPQYDTECMQILLKSRETILAFLKSQAYPLPQALTVLLMYAYRVQEWIDGSAPAALDPDRELQILDHITQPADLKAIGELFSSLEILTQRWPQRLSGLEIRPWNEALLPLAIYEIERYWLQAVSDYDLVCRVKFILTACILVNALGGDPVSTAQLFSKEIENDINNLETLLDSAYSHRAMTDMNLLAFLKLA